MQPRIPSVTYQLLQHVHSVGVPTCALAANSGTWIDDNESGWADEGEIVSYRITVTNEGTVSLGSLAVADSGGAVTCTVPDLGSLGQGESYACGASRQV